MKVNVKIFTILSLFCSCFVYAAAYDITQIASFFQSSPLKCYQCSSLYDDNCKNMTNEDANERMLVECSSKAQGCVKQIATTLGGKQVVFRECYENNINYFLANFKCGLPRDRHYQKVMCHKCRHGMCNNGKRVQATFWCLLSSLSVFVIVFLMKM